MSTHSKDDAPASDEKHDPATQRVAPASATAEDEGHIRARLDRFGLGKLFDAGVEARGIERVPENERESRHAAGVLVLWFSVNTVLTTIPIGMLAQPIFTLTLAHTAAVTVCFGLLGCMCVGFTAALGPRLGLRTMVATRYAYGYWGASVIALLNVLTQLGFSVVCVILAGQVLHGLNSNFPLVVGVVLIGVISVLICFVGYNLLHYYERFAWIVLLVIFIMIYALGGHAGYQPELQAAKEDPPGHLRAADILSFGGIIFSSCAGWAPVAADFNVRLPSSTNSTRVFWLTTFGVLIPVTFSVILGASLMTVPRFAEIWEDSDAAGVLLAVFEPWGRGGQFLLALLSLSVIANNIPNTYSAGLSMQALLPFFRRIPRALFTVLAFVIYTVAGVAGREHFSAILNNFLAILGYWIAFWIVILVEEQYLFRRHPPALTHAEHGNGIAEKDEALHWAGGYDLRAYDSPSLLPPGLAAIFASCVGVAGAVLGMAQVWYIGPIAKHLGPAGGDLGFELAAIFAAVVYPAARLVERRVTGR